MGAAGITHLPGGPRPSLGSALFPELGPSSGRGLPGPTQPQQCPCSHTGPPPIPSRPARASPRVPPSPTQTPWGLSPQSHPPRVLPTFQRGATFPFLSRSRGSLGHKPTEASAGGVLHYWKAQQTPRGWAPPETDSEEFSMEGPGPPQHSPPLAPSLTSSRLLGHCSGPAPAQDPPPSSSRPAGACWGFRPCRLAPCSLRTAPLRGP